MRIILALPFGEATLSNGDHHSLRTMRRHPAAMAPAACLMGMCIAVPPARAQDRVNEIIENGRRMVMAGSECDASLQSIDPQDVVVCADRQRGEKFRLPLPDEREQDNHSATRGDVPRASLDPGNNAPCGIFQSQRKCSKEEAKAFGYGNGRDPLTFARKLFGLIVDPDAETDDKPLIPSEF